jgi:hypothetical protein
MTTEEIQAICQRYLGQPVTQQLLEKIQSEIARAPEHLLRPPPIHIEINHVVEKPSFTYMYAVTRNALPTVNTWSELSEQRTQEHNSATPARNSLQGYQHFQPLSTVAGRVGKAINKLKRLINHFSSRRCTQHQQQELLNGFTRYLAELGEPNPSSYITFKDGYPAFDMDRIDFLCLRPPVLY